MGAKISPSLTDLRLFEILQEILKKFKYTQKIKLLQVYRDDGFILIDTDENKIQEFFSIANNIHPLLKFTYTISKKEIQFLDTTVFKGKRFEKENILDVKLYRKPTDNFQYLDKSSAHPESVFKGFLMGEITRFIRSSNNTSDLQSQINLFKHKLTKRGYKKNYMEPIFSKTVQTPRSNTLSYNKKEMKTAPPLVFATKYNPAIKNLGKHLRKHWQIIKNDQEANLIFPKVPIIAYRKHKNLGEFLTSSKL